MAITILNNLYPPLISSSYMPAFIYTETCKIYFSLSEYNNINQLLSNYPVQVTIRNIKTNQNVLSNSLYPSGIKLCNMIEENSLTQDSKYYIQLRNSDIQGGFLLNEYYQVQLRFTGNAAAAPPSSGIGIDKWLSQNLSYFSEWSTIVLIYGISIPSLHLKYYNLNTYNTNQHSSLKAIISGTMINSDSTDKETLKCYKILLQDYNDSNHIYEDSGWLYPNNYNGKNELFYKIKYDIQKQKYYKIIIIFETKNGYITSNYFYYYWDPIEEALLDLYNQVIPDNENGGIRIHLMNKDVKQAQLYGLKYIYETNYDRLTGRSVYLITTDEPTTGKFRQAYFVNDKNEMVLQNYGDMLNQLTLGTQVTIRRASSKDNFITWEELSHFLIEGTFVGELIWDDYTIEPGVWYKYKIFKKDAKGDFAAELETDKTMVYTDSIFLSTEKEQLKVCFNPQISNFTIKTTDSVIETIGSQYPYIRREGNIYYKTFSLSGIISYLSDINSNLFNSSKDELYFDNNITELYNSYNQEHEIGIYKDFVREREFRNKVMEFLYNDEIKLFRSLTEGNLLVKISNISLTPNITLGRMIYSFSCTVYEIAKATPENLLKYHNVLQKKHEVQK